MAMNYIFELFKARREIGFNREARFTEDYLHFQVNW